MVIGQQFVVPSYSKVSLLQQPTKQDSDEELEYADDSNGIVEIPCNFLTVRSFLSVLDTYEKRILVSFRLLLV